MPDDLAQLLQLPRPVYGRTDTLPNRVLEFEHQHPWIQVAYAIEGAIDLLTPQGRYIAPPQRAVWIPPGLQHRVRCTEGSVLRSLYIEPAVSNAPSHCRVLEVSCLLRELIDAFSDLPEEYDLDGPDGRLAGVLLDRLAAAPEVGLMLPLPSDPRLAKLCALMQQHPHSQKSLAEWCASLQLSERTVTRLFSQQTGLTFRRWRQRLRLLTALKELEAQRSVTEVALACGYETTSAFVAAFRAQFGFTPGALTRAGARRRP